MLPTKYQTDDMGSNFFDDSKSYHIPGVISVFGFTWSTIDVWISDIRLVVFFLEKQFGMRSNRPQLGSLHVSRSLADKEMNKNKDKLSSRPVMSGLVAIQSLFLLNSQALFSAKPSSHSSSIQRAIPRTQAQSTDV